MKRLLLIFAVLSLVLMAGCAKKYNPEMHECEMDCLEYFEKICKSDLDCGWKDNFYHRNCENDGNYVPEFDEYKCLSWYKK